MKNIAIVLLAVLNSITLYAVEIPDNLTTNEFGNVINATFTANIFVSQTNTYNYQVYNASLMHEFLNNIIDKFDIGDIIQVDSLKWKKGHDDHTGVIKWTPFPNPPVPTLKDSANVREHIEKYAKWINDHPHFGYPPIPMERFEH